MNRKWESGKVSWGEIDRQKPMPLGSSRLESQRDSDSKPRVARDELPWEKWATANNPNGVVARRRQDDATPLGLKTPRTKTQGSSCLATLGWRTQSLWDCNTDEYSSVPRNSFFVWSVRKRLSLSHFLTCPPAVIRAGQPTLRA
jgi:hypothetical protein